MDRGTVTQVLADRLRRLRAERGWSAQRLADECARAGFGSLTRSTIAKIESGTRKSVTADEVAALAHVLDVTPTDLLASPARSEAVHRTIVVADVANPPDTATQLAEMRHGLYDVLKSAFAAAGIDFAVATVADRGDGVLVLLPPEVPKEKLAGPFPNRLTAALRRHNSVHGASVSIQLRLVLHAGEVRQDDSGVAGPAVDTAVRLIEAQEAKSALRLAPNVLALIVSDAFYQEEVRHDPGTDPEAFRRIEVKNARTNAWLRLFDDASSPRRGRVPAVWGGVPVRNPNFVGRAELLDELDADLAEGATVVVPAALHGMGGIGKSQLAIEYVYRHLDRYDLVWWIGAWAPDRIRADLAELAPHLRLPADPDTAVPAVLEALRLGEPYRRWLLIFDNAESPDAVQKFLPANGPGEVLITSRNPDWSGIARPLGVPVFNRSESVELMRRRGLDIDDEAEYERLAERLGDLPLAVEQAAAMQVVTGMPVSEYLRLFDEKVAEVLDVSASAGHGISVSAAWNTAFDELTTRNPGAHQLLQVCAFFASAPIARNMLTEVPGVSVSPELDAVFRDPLKLARVIRDINRYGLAKIDHRNGTIQLHQLIQLTLRNRMDPNDRDQMRHAAHLLLAAHDPGSPASPRHWARYRELLVHATAADVFGSTDNSVRQLVINLVRFRYASDDRGEAADMARRVHEQWGEQFGEAEQLETATLVGLTLFSLGQFAEAADINRRTLDRCREILGEDHEKTVVSELLVARDLMAEGEFARAREFFEKIHEKAVRLFGRDDPVTLAAEAGLAVNLRRTGAGARARAHDEHALQGFQAALGTDHPDTIACAVNLAGDLAALGDVVGAEAARLEASERARRVLGEEHLVTLAADLRADIDPLPFFGMV